jgi:hypothetical protein
LIRSRYPADGLVQDKTWSLHAQSYEIQVTYRIMTSGKALRVLATPVTLAVDA